MTRSSLLTKVILALLSFSVLVSAEAPSTCDPVKGLISNGSGGCVCNTERSFIPTGPNRCRCADNRILMGVEQNFPTCICKDNFFTRVSDNTCVPCPIGTKSSAGQTQCNCLPNRTPAPDNSGKCLCKEGFRTARNGQCIQCPVGSTVPMGGTQCICLPNRVPAPDGSGKCLCRAGFRTDIETDQCIECPVGKTTEPGMVECQCKPNRTPAPGGIDKCLCREGFRTAESGECKKCPYGFTAPQGGTTCSRIRQ